MPAPLRLAGRAPWLLWRSALLRSALDDPLRERLRDVVGRARVHLDVHRERLQRDPVTGELVTAVDPSLQSLSSASAHGLWTGFSPAACVVNFAELFPSVASETATPIARSTNSAAVTETSQNPRRPPSVCEVSQRLVGDYPRRSVPFSSIPALG